MRLRSLLLNDLAIEDERSFRHVPVYARLKQRLVDDAYPFRVPADADEVGAWPRVLFLNLTWWNAATASDVLQEASIPADVVTHVAWHHVVRAALGADAATADGMLLGESVASAFDLYLLGRLLRHAPRSTWLRAQIPIMTEAAEAAGMPPPVFAALLEEVTADPSWAFESLRALLFDAGTRLLAAGGLDDAAAILDDLDDHRLSPLLHHYELSNWILYARAHAGHALGPIPAVRAFDAELRAAPDSLSCLERRCLP
jgi:hypothetical protein